MARRKTGGKIGGPYGTRNGAAKLTEEQVREIRRRHNPVTNNWHPHPNGTCALAREFGVNRRTIRAVLDGEVWGWLE